MEKALEKLKKASGSIKDILNMMLEDVERFMESSISYYATYDEDTEILTMTGWSMSAMANCRLITKPIVYSLEETGLWGDAVRERGPCITNDYENAASPNKKGYPESHVKVQRHLNIPVFDPDDEDEIVGVIGIGNKKEEYTDEDAKKLMDFAQQAIVYLSDHID